MTSQPDVALLYNLIEQLYQTSVVIMLQRKGRVTRAAEIKIVKEKADTETAVCWNCESHQNECTVQSEVMSVCPSVVTVRCRWFQRGCWHFCEALWCPWLYVWVQRRRTQGKGFELVSTLIRQPCVMNQRHTTWIVGLTCILNNLIIGCYYFRKKDNT